MAVADTGLECRKLDADQILGGLWQGSFPADGNDVRGAGFDVLVFCALEKQPESNLYPGVRVLRARMDDRGLDEWTKDTAHAIAREVAAELLQGRRVLVTCAGGHNRSGIVAALALWYTTQWPGQQCVEHVRTHRAGSLTNWSFVEHLRVLPPRDQATCAAIECEESGMGREGRG